MGIVCNIAGHKWNKLADGSDGCTCVRCGERRDEGHVFQFEIYEERDFVRHVRTCREVCSVCGKPREVEHDWNGCRCSRCDAIRDQGHSWGKPFSTKSKTHHSMVCRTCGSSKRSPHSFERIKGGIQRCTECCFEIKPTPKFKTPKSESDYYANLIASGKVGYYDIETKRGQIYVLYGDHVTTVPALVRLFTALANNNGADNYAPKTIADKLNEIAAEHPEKTDEIGAAFAKIACDERVHIYWRSWVIEHDWIKDPELLEKARKSVERWCKDHPCSQADIDYENAMIAADSGIGRSG